MGTIDQRRTEQGISTTPRRMVLAATGVATVAAAVVAAAIPAGAQTATSTTATDPHTQQVATVLAGVLVALWAYGLYSLVRRLRPMRTKHADPRTLYAGGKRHHLYTCTGWVTDASKRTETRTGGSFNAYGGNVWSTTTVHDQFFVEAPDGTHHSFQLQGFDAAVGEGHLVTVAWAIRRHHKRGPYLAVHNHTTGATHWNDQTIQRLARGPRHTARVLCVAWLALWLVPAVALAASVVVLVPALIAIKAVPRARATHFERGGSKALLGELARSASGLTARSHDHVSAADELTHLSELAQQGLLDDAEWTRAKALYLGQAPSARELALSNLAGIHQLYRQGALSESEFNMKKWEILARESRATV